MTALNTNQTTYNAAATLAAGRDASAETLSRVSASQEMRILAVVFSLLALWGVSIATFGYPALILPVLAAVPVIFVLLLMITVGK